MGEGFPHFQRGLVQLQPPAAAKRSTTKNFTTQNPPRFRGFAFVTLGSLAEAQVRIPDLTTWELGTWKSMVGSWKMIFPYWKLVTFLGSMFKFQGCVLIKVLKGKRLFFIRLRPFWELRCFYVLKKGHSDDSLLPEIFRRSSAIMTTTCTMAAELRGWDSETTGPHDQRWSLKRPMLRTRCFSDLCINLIKFISDNVSLPFLDSCRTCLDTSVSQLSTRTNAHQPCCTVDPVYR